MLPLFCTFDAPSRPTRSRAGYEVFCKAGTCSRPVLVLPIGPSVKNRRFAAMNCSMNKVCICFV
jgi:hypothetical protein